MKKIALTLIAVSALGVAACTGTAGNNASNEVNSGGEAVEDTNGAMNDMRDNASGVDANGTEANTAGAGEVTANEGTANGVTGNEAR